MYTNIGNGMHKKCGICLFSAFARSSRVFARSLYPVRARTLSSGEERMHMPMNRLNKQTNKEEEEVVENKKYERGENNACDHITK